MAPAGIELDAEGAVVLRRLLAVATLSPAQAAVLAGDLVEELEKLRLDDRCPGQIGDRSTAVSPSGFLRLVADDSDVNQAAGAWDSADSSAASLIRRLVVNASRCGALRRAEAARLTECINGPSTGATELAQRVRAAVAQVIGPDEERIGRTRRELGSLVAATKGKPPPPDRDPFAVRPQHPAPPPVPLLVSPTAVLAPDGWRPSSRRAWHRKRSLRARRSVLVGLIAVLLVATAWWGVPRAWEELERGWDAVFTPRQPSQQLAPISPSPDRQHSRDGSSIKDGRAATSGTGADPKAVTLPAPQRADPVERVTIKPSEGRCVAGKACAVRVDVLVRRAGTARQVSWSLRIIDRCSGKVRTHPGVTMTAQAGWGQVYGISRPELPQGTALAIVAVTSAPARAASAPLLIPFSGARC